MRLNRSLWISIAWFVSLAAKGFTYELAPQNNFASISDDDYRTLEEFQYGVAYLGTKEQISILRVEKPRIDVTYYIGEAPEVLDLADKARISITYFVRSTIHCYQSDSDVCLTAIFQNSLELKSFKILMMLPSLSGSVDDYEKICDRCNSSLAYGFQFRGGTRKVIKFTDFGPVF
jgi:hypothetical protein